LKKKYDISKDTIGEWIAEDSETKPSGEVILQTEDALVAYTSAHSLAPPAALRDKILQKISTLNAQKNERRPLHLDNLPLLDRTSNWLDWKEVIEGIAPPEDFENIHLHPLESNEKRELFVAWVKEYVEEEVHHDLLESFLILEGSCECHITDESGNTRVVRMGAGDFITMQIGETHDIRITSLKPTKAILQWEKLAA
jgi:mannose-6-phosphate isomerase-like protein (cupin superfamily)